MINDPNNCMSGAKSSEEKFFAFMNFMDRSKQYKVCLHNIDGVGRKYPFLANFVDTRKVDIMLSSGGRPEHDFKLREFEIIRVDRPNAPQTRSVAIQIRHGIPYTQLPPRQTSIEHVDIQLEDGTCV
ncbi:hypothetical protein JTB14_025769 [Gonioctena quinquepunctata]|nr:hypothetical protein JTB14_025769 [Gonioctena quinquepunctata]